MKRFLLICLTAMFAVASWAYEFSEDGFYYNVVSTDEMTCEVTSGDNAYTGDIVIPSTADGYTVVGIGSNAFNSCTGVTSLIVPSTVTSVGLSAFAGCTSLATVTFEEGEAALEFITDGVFDTPFANCPVTTLYMGRQYSSSGGKTYATFRTLDKLETLTLGQYVTELELCAFHDCSSLKELVIEDADTELFFNTAWWEEDDCYHDDNEPETDETEPFYSSPLATVYMGRNLNYTYNKVTMASYRSPFQSAAVKNAMNSITFGQNVTTLPENLLNGCSLITEIDIPENITSIGNSAFYGTGITEIKLKDTITHLGSGVFYKCTSLLTADTGSGLTALVGTTFSGCTALQTVTLGENIESLQLRDFENCTALESVTSLNHEPPTCSDSRGADSSNGYFAFHNVDLSKVTLYVPEGTTEDYKNSALWSNFTNIQEIVEEKTQFEVDGIYYKVIDPEADEKEVEVTYGGETATSGTEAYTGDITIPATVNDNNTLYTVIGIGDNAFRNCKGLASVTIAEENITYIGEHAFRESSIKTVSLGAVETIHEHAFDGSGLTSLTLPDNVTTIEPYAFYECTSMTSLTIGKGLKVIDEYVFGYCDIASLVIPDNVEEIGDYAFYRCMQMKSIEIGSGLKTIGAYAFYWSGLTELTIPSTVSSVGDYAFSDNLSLVTVNVDAETIGMYAFYGAAMYELNIGDNVQTMGRNAFDFCANITSLYIPGSVDISATQMFQNCYSLEKVEIGEGMTTCGAEPFQYCRSLTDVTLPESFTTITVWMFNGCTSLKSITLPKNIATISSGAFLNVPLEEIYSYNPTPPTISYKAIFEDVYDTCVLYVPCDYVETYATTGYWSNFVNIVGIDCQEELGEFACTVDPADESVLNEPLSQITFSNDYGIYFNEEEEHGYEGDPIIVYDSEDNDVAYIENITPISGSDGETEIGQIVMFDTAVSDPGDYTVVVPACFFYSIDEEGRRGFNKALTLTYTIKAETSSEPDYEIVVSPESGETLESLSTISLTCEDGIMWNTLGWGDIVIYDEEDSALDVVIDYKEVAGSTGTITEVILTISPAITVDGEYRVEIPEGYFLIAGTVESKAITLNYTIKVNGGTETGISGISINSDNVEGIYSTSGQKLNTTVKGVNIVLYNDGSVKKIYVK